MDVVQQAEDEFRRLDGCGGDTSLALIAEVKSLRGTLNTPGKFVHTLSSKIQASFCPQAWSNDSAVGVDVEGECSWFVDLSDLDSEADDNDYLRQLDGVPSWIKGWSGPFEITLECLIRVTTLINATGPVDQRLLDHLGQRAESAFMKLCSEGDATPSDSPRDAYPWTALELVGVESSLSSQKDGVK